MLDDIIIHISEIIDKHRKCFKHLFTPLFLVTLDRLEVLISLLGKLHLPPIEVAVSTFCSINIALLVESDLISSLPAYLLDMVQHNLNCWSSRHCDVSLGDALQVARLSPCLLIIL